MAAIRLNPREIAEKLKATEDDPYVTTPITINEHILDMVSKFAEKPFYLPVQETVGEVLNDCFNVVARKMQRDGGSMVHGWAFWEWPTMFVEGEHHAVWRGPTGNLIDVVPRPHGEKRILFLPEPLRTFSGSRTGNIRRKISDAEEVWYFLTVSEKIEELMGPEVGDYRITPELAEQEILRGHFQLLMRDMTPREFVDAARAHARLPLL